MTANSSLPLPDSRLALGGPVDSRWRERNFDNNQLTKTSYNLLPVKSNTPLQWRHRLMGKGKGIHCTCTARSVANTKKVCHCQYCWIGESTGRYRFCHVLVHKFPLRFGLQSWKSWLPSSWCAVHGKAALLPADISTPRNIRTPLSCQDFSQTVIRPDTNSLTDIRLSGPCRADPQ